MGEIFPVPRVGDEFRDVRDGDRTMRISSHVDRGALVVSLWVGAHCRASFRMAAGDLDRLMSTLDGIRASLGLAAEPAASAAGIGPAAAMEPATGTEPAAGTDREPPVEQTGDVTGSVSPRGRTQPPVLRVA
jgi:hypothetical protein